MAYTPEPEDRARTSDRERYRALTIGDQLRELERRLSMNDVFGDRKMSAIDCFADLNLEAGTPAWMLARHMQNPLRWRKYAIGPTWNGSRHVPVVKAIAQLVAAQPGDADMALAALQ